MSTLIFPPSNGIRQSVTDWYLLLLLGLYPLIVGQDGYSDLSKAKYGFLLIITGVWLLFLVLLTIFSPRPKQSGNRLDDREAAAEAPLAGRPELLALLFAGICFLSWLLSPWRASALVGAARRDGLITKLLLCAVFLGTLRFGRLTRTHCIAVAVSALVYCGLSVLQYFGRNPLGMYQGSATFANAGEDSFNFLGPLGNVDIVAQLISLTVPLFFSLCVRGGQPKTYGRFYHGALFAAALTGFLGNADAGILAMAACALIIPALQVRDLPAARRYFTALSLLPLAYAVATVMQSWLVWHINPGLPVSLMIRLAVRRSLPFLAASVCLLLLSLGMKRIRVSIPEKSFFRLVVLCLTIILLAGFLAVWFWPGTSGTIYELSQILHGKPRDSFGSHRIMIWRGALYLFPDRPFLGGGPDTTPIRLRVAYSSLLPSTRISSVRVRSVHNVFLQYLDDLGFLGLSAYLALLAVCCLRKPFSARSLLLPCVLCYCIQDCFGIGYFTVSPIFWAVLALAAVREPEAAARPAARRSAARPRTAQGTGSTP